MGSLFQRWSICVDFVVSVSLLIEVRSKTRPQPIQDTLSAPPSGRCFPTFASGRHEYHWTSCAPTCSSQTWLQGFPCHGNQLWVMPICRWQPWRLEALRNQEEPGWLKLLRTFISNIWQLKTNDVLINSARVCSIRTCWLIQSNYFHYIILIADDVPR